MVSHCSLLNVDSVGPRFTWRGNRWGDEVLVRLDRFLATSDWFQYFPQSRALNLKPSKSDHLPILMEVREARPKKKRKKKRFRFEEFWLREEECKKIVESSWNNFSASDPFSTLCCKIGSTRKALLDWSRNLFDKLKEDINVTSAQLAYFFDSTCSMAPIETREFLESKLNDLLHKEQIFWKQRSKIFWLTDGDLNTKFFHQQASNRRRKNVLKGLFNCDGDWCTNDEDLEKVILHYYETLFSSSQPTNIWEVTNHLPRIITDEMNLNLTREFTNEEIFLALKQMHPSKAPGPDGFSPSFYQHFWPLVGKDVVMAVRCFLESDLKMQRVNCTNVALIPKVKSPQYMSQLRPISLCNVLYKIGSKALANRLKPLLHHFISPYQSAFVPGRQISDNSLLAFEIAHSLKQRREGKVGYGALKLDMSKAYDRVEWSFLEAAMLKLGFSSDWVMKIMRCVRTVSYSFMLNGEPRGKIIPTRGLRQGDAISPYLFLICAEALSRLISTAETQHRLHGMKVCRRAPSISHLFFADDSLIFFRANASECNVIKEILLSYEYASGQKINFDKSQVSFSRNVPLDTQVSLALVLNVQRVDKHDKYLGLPMEISHSKIEAFGYLKEKTQKKLQGWREKTLSAAGKEVLIKAVIQSIPTYVMSCFQLPKQLCWDIQQLMANFWWGAKGDEKKIHWLAWDNLCVPKKEGGMGFRNLALFNLSLLAKQGWRLLMFPDSLMAQVLKARYFPNTDFINAVELPGMSFSWRSILAGRAILSKGTRFQIGEGKNVSLWDDPWLPLPYSFKPFSPPMEGTELWRVGDIIDHENGEWIKPVIHDLFTEDEAQLILKIPLSLRPVADRHIWHYERKGVFTVKSGYHVARIFQNLTSHVSSSSGSNEYMWNKLWGLRVPPKVLIFIWKMLRGILPTKMALIKKHVQLDVECVFCHSTAESDLHLFKLCGALKWFWQASNFGLIPFSFSGHTLFDWFLEVSNMLPANQLELFCMCLWIIWVERNNIIWNNGLFNPAHMVSYASKSLEDYQKFHPSSSKNGKRPLSHWKTPPTGRLKINVDGSFQSGLEHGGIGVIIRDDLGRCIAALSRSLTHVSSAIQVEAEACRAGLLLAINNGWDNVILESDCAMLVTALSSESDDLSQIGRIVDDCKEFTSSFHSICFRHVYREANCVANRLAHIASISVFDNLWLHETPSIIEDVLFEDLCNCKRGLGITSPSLPIISFHQ